MAYLKFQCSFSAISLLLLTILVLSSANYDGGYKYNGSKPYSDEKPKPENDNILSTTIGIQGIVYCKEGHDKPFPLEGAVVRITCDVVDKFGFETTPFSFLSEATKESGYFLATLCPSEISANRKLTKCKAFLEVSPSDTCNDPMDVNNAVSGALLSSHHFLVEKKMKMYTVGPFFFTTEPQPVSNGPWRRESASQQTKRSQQTSHDAVRLADSIPANLVRSKERCQVENLRANKSGSSAELMPHISQHSIKQTPTPTTRKFSPSDKVSPQDSQKEEKLNKNNMENNGKGQGKKKTTHISAGGNVGGLVVVGGALVIGGLLMAIFASKRNKPTDSNDKNPTTAAPKVSKRSNGGCLKKKEDHGSQGLRCVLQTSSSVALRLSSSSCAGHGSSSMGLITHVIEQRLTTESDGIRISETVLPDSQEIEIIKLSDDSGAVQDEKYDNENPVPIETTEEVKNREETSSADQDSDMHSAEDGEDGEESVAENDNEGSDDTGYSSMESNTDAVWPAELIEDTMPELEEASQAQRSGKEYKTCQTERPTRFNTASVFHNEAKEENMTRNRQISKLWVRLLTLLMLVLYFLLIYLIPRLVVNAKIYRDYGS